MLICEGYKMFKGSAMIVPKNPKFKPHKEHGVWLFKPEHRCWYCGGVSYPEEIVQEIEED